MSVKNIVPIANMAGSAGKTTTAVTLAALLAEKGRRVLLCDFDAQSNSTEWLGCDPNEVERSSAAVLLKECSLVDAIVETDVEGLLLLPASRRTMDADVLRLQAERGAELRFRVALRSLPDDIDDVIVDCPGSMGVMTLAALMVATSVITVTAPTSKELKGIPMLEDVIEEVAELNGDTLTLGAVVPCIVPPASAGRLYQDALTALRARYGELVTPSVRRAIRAPEAQSHATPLSLHAPNEPITADYRAVLENLEQRGIL